jgi:alpha-1,2-mannosyltransferase
MSGRFGTTGRDLALGWAVLAIGAVVAWLLLRHQWALDLTALYFAAKFYGAGQADLVYLPGASVFIGTPPPDYLALFVAETGLPAEEARLTPYLYPPLWAALLAPLAGRVSAVTFFDIFQLANLAALAGTIWLGWRFVRPPGMGFALWALLSVGLFAATGAGAVGLWFGQPQILVSFIIMLAAWLLAERHDIGAGAALALAAAIKLSPALLVVWFIMERRWRALGAFVVAGAGLAAVSVALAGWPLHAEMLAKIAAIDGHVLISRIVVSLELWLAQLSGTGAPGWSFAAPVMVPEPGWIGWVVRLALVAGLALSWAATRGLDDRARLWARLLAVLLVTLVTSPLGWVHYLALPLLLLPGFVHLLAPGAVLRLVVVSGTLLSMPLLALLARSDALAFVQAGLNLAVALGLLGLLLTRARRARPWPDQALRPSPSSL